MIIYIFIFLFISYGYYLYKNNFKFISLFFLTVYSISFLLPNLINNPMKYGFVLTGNEKDTLNNLYLLGLMLFIAVNFPFHFLKFNVKEKNLNFFTHRRIKFLLILFIILSGGLLFSFLSGIIDIEHSERNVYFSIIHSFVVVGFILIAGLNFLYSSEKQFNLLAFAILLLSIFFGTAFVFGRRLVIYPLIALFVLYIYKKGKVPRISLVISVTVFIITIVLPLMMSIRTLGFFKGITNFYKLITETPENYLTYLAIGTDVNYSYSLASIVVENDVRVDKLTLLKPLFTFIPRSIWPDKPLPLSENIVQIMNLPFEQGMSIPLGFIGEAYVYFGIYGIFIWTISFAFMCAIIDSYSSIIKDMPGNYKNIQLIIITITFIQIIMGSVRGDTATNLLETTYLFVPLTLIFILSKYRIKF